MHITTTRISGRTIAEIARFTKALNPGNTLHIYLEPDGSLNCYEDVSGQESYPGEKGEWLMDTEYSCTRSEIAENLMYHGFGVPIHLIPEDERKRCIRAQRRFLRDLAYLREMG